MNAGAGPEAVELRADVPIAVEGQRLDAEFIVGEGERVGFVLTWHSSWEDAPPRRSTPLEAVDETDAMVASVVGALDVRGRMEGRGRALPHHAEGADLRADRGHRRRRRRPRCPSSSAGCGTGTTGSAGSGTRRSRSTR